MSVSLLDVTGRQLQTQTTDKKEIKLSVAGYAPGLYYCHISVNGEKIMRRITVK